MGFIDSEGKGGKERAGRKEREGKGGKERETSLYGDKNWPSLLAASLKPSIPGKGKEYSWL